MDTKEISMIAQVIVVQVPVQQVVVNGVEQNVMGEAIALVCPVCGQIIQQFQPGISMGEVFKSLYTDDEESLKAYIHCVKCGQKVSLMRPSPIDVEYEVLSTEVAENA